MTKNMPPIEAPRTKAAKKERRPAMRFLKILGPGLITGASDDDPSGIITYSQAGSQFGFKPLWSALFTYPLMACVQYICAKIGLVTGEGLTCVIRKNYPRWILYASVFLLVVANTMNAGADLGAIAACIHSLVPAVSHDIALVAVTFIIIGTLVFASFDILTKTFKWLTISLFAYIGAALLTHPSWPQVAFDTLVPQVEFSKSFVSIMVAILGTTISPYLFFWQTRSEVEEQRRCGMSIWQRKGATDDDLKYAAVDVNWGMFLSNVVMFFIIISSAASLHAHGIHNINSPDQAAQALRPIAGNAATLLFSVGIIGTGFLGVPVLVGSSAFAMSELFGWRRGLNEKWYRAKKFYATIAGATATGMAMNFFHINPMSALVWVAIINGLLAPPLLILIMLISTNKKIMGKQTNHPVITALGWLTAMVMTVAAISLIYLTATGS